jgi:hypothetical protein
VQPRNAVTAKIVEDRPRDVRVAATLLNELVLEVAQPEALLAGVGEY